MKADKTQEPEKQNTHLQLPRQKEEDGAANLAQKKNVCRVADSPSGVNETNKSKNVKLPKSYPK